MKVPRGGSKVQLPLWPMVGLGALVLIILAVLATLVVTKSQPSDADLAVRAAAGDREAAAKLEEKYAAPVPKVVTTKKITFVPGAYTSPKKPDQITDIGEFVASFLLHLDRGEIDQAAKFMATPNYPLLREAASFFDEEIHSVIAQEGVIVPKEAGLAAVNSRQLGDYRQGGYDYIEAGDRKPIPVGYRYYVQGIYASDYVAIAIKLEFQEDGIRMVSID